MNDQEKINTIKAWLGMGSINIFGRPFAGKDFQGSRLAKLFNAELISGGKILRNDTTPNRIKEYVQAGQLIPSEDYAAIIPPYFQQPSLTDKSLILSSVGRWHGEENIVIEALRNSAHLLKAAIYLNISDDDIHNRWLAREIYKDRLGRKDDTEETIKIRLDEFEAKTLPVIEYYRNLGMLIEIDGSRSRDEVTDDIIDALNIFAQK
jgi:adenylate kinase